MSGLHLKYALVVVTCIAMFTLSAVLDVGNDFFGLALLTVTMVVAFYDASKNSLGAVVLFSGVTLYVLPTMSLYVIAPGGGGVQTAWFAAFILIGLIYTAADNSGSGAPLEGRSKADLAFVAIYLIVGIALWRGEGIGQVSFYAGWGAALLHLERLHATSESKFLRLSGVAIFGVVIGAFMIFLWAGSGRIIFLSFMLAPIFVTVRYNTFKLNTVLFVFVATTLPFVGRVMRFGWSDGIVGIAEDSGTSHLTETSYLWSTSDAVISTGSIAEQWLLLFFGWVPRDVWPNKPLGIGSSFVDIYLGRVGQSQEHSTATGYFGEHLFFWPNFWWVSVILLTAVVLMLRRAVVRIAAPYKSAAIAFDVWLITLFWGGMASFGARLWLALVPMLAYALVLKALDRREERLTLTRIDDDVEGRADDFGSTATRGPAGRSLTAPAE